VKGVVWMGGRDEPRVKRPKPPPVGRFWRSVVSALPRVGAYVIGSVLDFLVEDVCVLCGRPYRRSVRKPVEIEGPAEHLLEPVRILWVGGRVTVTNHPVCASCARSLEIAETVGVIGTFTRPGTIETVSGERFVVVGSNEEVGDWGDQTGRTNPVEKISVIAPFMINDNSLKLIHLLKFSGYAALARPIAGAIAHAVRGFGVIVGGAHVIVPVPMDPASRARRGFNQAERIARELAGDLEIPVSVDFLQKTVRTGRQSGTKRELRAANVRGAFVCRDAAGEEPAGKHVLLVDDLVTTGATAASCAATLFGAGAESVTVLSFGRAL